MMYRITILLLLFSSVCLGQIRNPTKFLNYVEFTREVYHNDTIYLLNGSDTVAISLLGDTVYFNSTGQYYKFSPSASNISGVGGGGIDSVERKIGTDSVFQYTGGVPTFTYRDTAGQWVSGVSKKKISFADSVYIGSFGGQKAELLVTSDNSGNYSQLAVRHSEVGLYSDFGGAYYGGVAAAGYKTILGAGENHSHIAVHTYNETITIPDANTIFSGATTASDSDHYTTLGDVPNKFEGKDSLSHMIIEFAQTGTSAPTYTIRENTSPYTVASTAYVSVGNYTLDFDNGACSDCMDAGKYYIRTQTFWSSTGSNFYTCGSFIALNYGYTFNLVVGDLMGSTYDDIGDPFSIEIVWYHEQ